MKKTDVIFEEPLSLKLVEEFEKKIYYLSEDIISYERIYKDEKIIGERLSLEDDKHADKIRDRALHVIKNEILGLKDIKVNRFWNNEGNNKFNNENIIEELIKSELIYIPSDGQVSFKEPLVSLFDFFDTVFKNISTKIFKCENYRFPTLLRLDVLKKVGYFESFPNLLMFTTRLRNAVDNYEAFKNSFTQETEEEEIADGLMEYCCNTSFGLPPTMCYYVYDMLSGKEIKQKAITTCGKSFRYENKYYKPFERLWDFTIRETVFIGDYNYVRNNVNEYKKMAVKLMDLLNMSGFCETANDPFFLIGNAAKRINAQKMFGSKYELRLKLSEDNTTAVGSFNLHSNFLAKRFRFYSNLEKEEYCYTGCIGIGLERMMFAFLSQYGFKQENWPSMVREGIDNPLLVNKYIDKLLE